MNDLKNKTYKDRINDIQNNLYIGGGIQQAKTYYITSNTAF